MSQRRLRERGATALVVVMFSVLMFVIVSVGFMRLMTNEVSRTNDSELSQGAYDSAMAGVEDGKRVLAACAAANYDSNNPACIAINKQDCSTVSAAGVAGTASSSEVLLRTSVSDKTGEAFQQAYTCVKIARNTTYYNDTLSADTSLVVPLTSVGPFSQIILRWKIAGSSDKVGLPPVFDASLPAASGWANDRPALMRTQLIQFASGTSINQETFDNSGNGSTLYLSPASGTVGPSSAVSFSIDGRHRNGSDNLAPKPVVCASLGVYNSYNCQVTLDLQNPFGEPDGSRRSAYLRLASLYRASDFQVELVGTEFNGVQPTIDSTGRAADVFRRVVAHVGLDDPGTPYPRATVDATNNFCKTIIVSNTPSDYMAGSCDPTKP